MTPELHFTAPRNSRMALNEVYFWTDTVHEWRRLLQPDQYKTLILDQLRKLVGSVKLGSVV
jgi:putative transposase